MRFSISCPLLLNYSVQILTSQRVNKILSLNWHLMPCPTLAGRARLGRHSLYQCTIPSVSAGAKSSNSDMELIVSFRVGSIFPTKAASLDLFSVNICSPCCHFSLKGTNKALISMSRTGKSDIQKEEIWNYRSDKFLLILLKNLKSLKDNLLHHLMQFVFIKHWKPFLAENTVLANYTVRPFVQSGVAPETNSCITIQIWQNC